MKTEYWIAFGAGVIFISFGLGSSFYQGSKFSQALNTIKTLDASNSVEISTRARNKSDYRKNDSYLDFFSSVDDFEAYSLGKRADEFRIESVGRFRIVPNDLVVKLLVNPNGDEYVYGYVGRESKGVYYNYGSFRSSKLIKSMWFSKYFSVLRDPKNSEKQSQGSSEQM